MDVQAPEEYEYKMLILIGTGATHPEDGPYRMHLPDNGAYGFMGKAGEWIPSTAVLTAHRQKY
jgi:hypothetical protein